MVPYALYTIPNVGDHIIKATKARGYPPTIVVCLNPTYFSKFKIPTLHGKDPKLIERLKAKGIQFIIVAGWPNKIPVSQYEWLPKKGWNIHTALLPKYRGYNPYFWPIANGESETGVTIHELVQKFDAGPILVQATVPIDPLESIGSLFNKLSTRGGEVACEGIKLIDSGKYKLKEQKPGDYPKSPLVKDDMLILKPSLTKIECDRLVRAANPFFGAILEINNHRLRVYEVSENGDGPQITCSDGILIATVVQLDENRTVISGKEYLRRVASG